MTQESEKPGKILVSHGQQMSTEHSEKNQPGQPNKENVNYNSRRGFLRGEATMEPVATTLSHIDQTQSVVHDQIDSNAAPDKQLNQSGIMSEKSGDQTRISNRGRLRSNSKKIAPGEAKSTLSQ